jgi:hypothetical protein
MKCRMTREKYYRYQVENPHLATRAQRSFDQGHKRTVNGSSSSSRYRPSMHKRKQLVYQRGATWNQTSLNGSSLCTSAALLGIRRLSRGRWQHVGYSVDQRVPENGGGRVSRQTRPVIHCLSAACCMRSVAFEPTRMRGCRVFRHAIFRHAIFRHAIFRDVGCSDMQSSGVLCGCSDMQSSGVLCGCSDMQSSG